MRISAPRVNTVFTSGRGIIEGNFTTQSAKELSLLINSGALPVSLEVVQSSRVEPTLGQDSVKRSLLAGANQPAARRLLHGRIPPAPGHHRGGRAPLLHRAHLRAVPSDPGDAHPPRAGKSLRAAVEEGRRRAFPSIAYSNAAMILTAGILFYFGTGTVKGFALTLGIGVAVSFFTAVIVTQMLLHGVIEFTRLRRRALRRRGPSAEIPSGTRAARRRRGLSVPGSLRPLPTPTPSPIRTQSLAVGRSPVFLTRERILCAREEPFGVRGVLLGEPVVVDATPWSARGPPVVHRRRLRGNAGSR